MKTIILGAGLAGLGAAKVLHEENADFFVIESSDRPGGLAKTDMIGGYMFDYTGHYLHIKSEEAKKDLLQGTIPFRQVERKSAVLAGERVIPYPVQYNLRYFDAPTIENVLDELGNIANRKTSFEHMEDFFSSSFGPTLYELFFKPYNEKLWGRSLDLIPRDALGIYFPVLDMALIRQGCFENTAFKGYNDSFYFPVSGKIGDLPLALAEPFTESINYSTYINEINLSEKFCEDANGKRHHYDRLISSIPFHQLLSMSGIQQKRDVFHYARVINLRLVVRGRLLHDNQWLYIPDRSVPFYRIGFPQNVSAAMCPPGYVMLSAEINAAMCNSDLQAIAELIISFLNKKGLMEATSIEQLSSVTIDPAYTYADEKEQMMIKRYTDKFARHDVYPIGRYGLWKYFSMEQAYLSGKAVARKCLNLSLIK